jgi:hypothetical protein
MTSTAIDAGPLDITTMPLNRRERRRLAAQQKRPPKPACNCCQPRTNAAARAPEDA